MKQSPLLLLLTLCPLASAQNALNGPGILTSQPISGIGQRAGRDVDLRLYGYSQVVRDTGLIPYAVEKDGKLLQPGALTGVEVGLGAYGRHNFRRSTLGLDYSGNFRHYPSATRYDGINQQLNLSYSYQKSRRLQFDLTTTAGSQSFGPAGGAASNVTDLAVPGTALFFDNRVSFLQGGLDVRYALTGRTTMVVGGSFYTVHRQSSALVGVNGYNLQGQLQHQLSRRTSIGASFQHIHYDFPRAFGEADINVYTGSWRTILGRSFNLTLSGGVFASAVQGIQSSALDPDVAALLGISTVQTIFYKENLLPTVTASLAKTFRRSQIVASYSRMVSPGNGLYLSSRSELISGGYSFTGTRRFSFSVDAGTSKLDSLGQNMPTYRQLIGTSTLNYKLGKGFNLAGSYSLRHHNFVANSLRRDSNRTAISLSFSPGDIPLSFR